LSALRAEIELPAVGNPAVSTSARSAGSAGLCDALPARGRGGKL